MKNNKDIVMHKFICSMVKLMKASPKRRFFNEIGFGELPVMWELTKNNKIWIRKNFIKA
jgi:hypothetical protein